MIITLHVGQLQIKKQLQREVTIIHLQKTHLGTILQELFVKGFYAVNYMYAQLLGDYLNSSTRKKINQSKTQSSRGECEPRREQGGRQLEAAGL